MELYVLLLLCFGMALGAFASGLIPLVFNLSPSKFKLLSSFGAGLLIGCALIVIIPEGIETITRPVTTKVATIDKLATDKLPSELSRRGFATRFPYIPQPDDKSHSYLYRRTDSPNDTSVVINPASGDAPVVISTTPDDTPADDNPIPVDTPVVIKPVPGDTPIVNKPKPVVLEKKSNLLVTPHPKEEASSHRAIGLALIAGFCFMFFIDQLTGPGGHSHTHIAIPTSSNSDTSLPSSLPSSKLSCSSEFSASLGLLIHAAADGIAMGAASVGEQTSVNLIIFLAIMLHKAPAALGLTTYLLKLDYKKPPVIRQLVIFSLAAPIMALLTHLSLFLFHLTEIATLQWATGWLLLFSGGTFLYVATIHSFPTIHSDGPGFQSYCEMGSVILGMLAPLLLPLD